jgi:hypothetical protein
VTDAELRALDERIERALDTGDESELDVIGYGEISSVVSCGGFACKRLPLFDSEARLDAYRDVFARYLAALRERGVAVVDSELRAISTAGGIALYCVQPIVPADRLAVRYLASAAETDAVALFDAVLDRMLAAIAPDLGLDAQLSNWVLSDDGGAGGVAFIDVTTPLLRDAGGREALDTDLFLASLPWALRGVVRRFFLRGILATYYDPRAAIVDLLGNLHKERLERLIPAFLDRANLRLDRDIDEREVRRYYASDARTWSSLLLLRRLDRGWQRKIRRRQYPFLLPGRIAR